MLKRFLLMILLVVSLFGSIYLFFDIKARLEFQQIQNELERIGSEVVEPMGGAWLSDKDVGRGRNLAERKTCSKAICPITGRSWSVRVEPYADAEILEDIARQSGFSYTNDYQWYSRNFVAYVTLEESEGLIPESNMPEGVEWKVLSIQITPRWR